MASCGIAAPAALLTFRGRFEGALPPDGSVSVDDLSAEIGFQRAPEGNRALLRGRGAAHKKLLQSPHGRIAERLVFVQRGAQILAITCEGGQPLEIDAVCGARSVVSCCRVGA